MGSSPTIGSNIMIKLLEKFSKTKTGKLGIYIYRRFFEKRPLVLLLSSALIINLITLLVVSFAGQREEGIIPLHYVIGQGIDKTGNWNEIYFIPGFLFLLTLLNFAIAKLLKTRDEIHASYFIVSATLIIQLFALLASILITSIV